MRRNKKAEKRTVSPSKHSFIKKLFITKAAWGSNKQPEVSGAPQVNRLLPQQIQAVWSLCCLTTVVRLQLWRRVDRHFAERAVEEAASLLLLRLRVRLGLGLLVGVRFWRGAQLWRLLVSRRVGLWRRRDTLVFGRGGSRRRRRRCQGPRRPLRGGRWPCTDAICEETRQTRRSQHHLRRITVQHERENALIIIISFAPQNIQTNMGPEVNKNLPNWQKPHNRKSFANIPLCCHGNWTETAIKTSNCFAYSSAGRSGRSAEDHVSWLHL